ncbi:helix-turn-helix transcriptional regulator [Sphingosinicella microcystinivorans]|uniref:DNA-binding CsgD family transcriptional regulator n=1 Tax=Sphingosinicella microcystinivorans TaxID=335406 RepID=A0AAD1D3A3_SPHMI|nr:helix-turn-helix transcriptional regulator [Sphingosinicella microcystinivorans]RKS88887.1 DNA-binding CsgD family transcriptional regulator [Sphingosinicella microcystinivorans]BBE32642.1 hypothetical protein SmB9_03000 [Sphingosinicella microcystinivorans]
MTYDALPRVISAIGEPYFHGVAAQTVCHALGFDLSALIFHRGGHAEPLFHDFDRIGCTHGMAAYAAVTHMANPMLQALPEGAVRARDFAVHDAAGLPSAETLIWTDTEELGFRTPGWPERQEEIGLYVPASGGTLELSLYRERGRTGASDGQLASLGMISKPLAAAFVRHAALCAFRPAALSARERDVYDLIVRGCSTEAVALRLGISRHTVKDHRKHIFRKLGVGSFAELIARHWARAAPSSEGLLPHGTTEH